jgi:phosphinothricin acetyltransferase
VKLTIKEMRPEDWPVVRAIYQEGINTGQSTFETVVPSWEVWDAGKRVDCRLIARQESKIVGWAALSRVSKRAVYAGVAEVSIYIAATGRGQGTGTKLLQALVAASEAAGVWTLQASLFPENELSIALHIRCGFRLVGYREKIANHHGRWRDTMLLERRSAKVGF